MSMCISTAKARARWAPRFWSVLVWNISVGNSRAKVPAWDAHVRAKSLAGFALLRGCCSTSTPCLFFGLCSFFVACLILSRHVWCLKRLRDTSAWQVALSAVGQSERVRGGFGSPFWWPALFLWSHVFMKGPKATRFLKTSSFFSWGMMKRFRVAGAALPMLRAHFSWQGQDFVDLGKLLRPRWNMVKPCSWHFQCWFSWCAQNLVRI